MNNHLNNYITGKNRTARKICVLILAAVIVAVIGWTIGSAETAEGKTVCWALCKTQVNVRMKPDKGSRCVGYLECGDEILTDGESRNGFIKVYGIGENGSGWVYAGYVATEKPVPVYANYVCVARNRVACRRWISGPQISGSPWLANGSNVTVIYIAGEWALTSRGYIRSEWLEVDPE